MLRCVRWPGVIAGVVVTVFLLLLLIPFVGSVVAPHIAAISGTDDGGVTAQEQSSYGALIGLSFVYALLLSFLVGSFLVGVVVRSYAALNGTVSAGSVLGAGLAALLVGTLLRFLDPISNPGEVYTRSENLQMFFIYVSALCALSPFVFLAGYLGGRLGGRLRSQAARSAA